MFKKPGSRTRNQNHACDAGEQEAVTGRWAHRDGHPRVARTEAAAGVDLPKSVKDEFDDYTGR
jgi:hypothetical protein